MRGSHFSYEQRFLCSVDPRDFDLGKIFLESID